MLSFLSCCFLAGTLPDHPPAEKAEESAVVKQLKEKGAEFSLYSSLVIHEQREAREKDRVGFFIDIRGNWKGTPQDLRAVNKLRNVRELAFTQDDFSDEWCAEINPVPSLESLF